MKTDPGPGGFWKFGEFDQIKGAFNPWKNDGSYMAPFDRDVSLTYDLSYIKLLMSCY